jgi:hypothetical protein
MSWLGYPLPSVNRVNPNRLTAVDSIADPVIPNPMDIESGELIVDGPFTFSGGTTVDSGSTLVLQGASTDVICSGALSGGGTIILEDGATFSTPGGTSGFTGTLQNQGGPVTPTLTVADPGGVYNGSPFPATATLSAPGISSASSLEGVSPTLSYYIGSTATGTASATAPINPGTYTVVGSFAGSTDYTAAQSDPVTFTITSAATAPVITTNPSNQSVAVGATATFTAAASGNPAPTVQWQVSTDGGKTFTNITGNASATTTTLSLPSVTASQTGREYQAVFTISQGHATTTAATLTVTPALTAPVVTTNPSNQSVAVGATATFTAVASGNPTPTVWWQVSTNGGTTFTNIAGAISTTYSCTATAAQSGCEYRAVFSNSQGNATTTAATLTVTAANATIIQDINDPGVYFTGRWWWATFEPGYYGTQFVNDGNQDKSKSVQFNLNLPHTGTYDVSVWYPAAANNASNVPVTITGSNGSKTVTVNERQNGGQWVDLGSYAFGTTGSVTFKTIGTNGLVVVDAVRFTPVNVSPLPVAPITFCAAPTSQTTAHLSWSETTTGLTGYLLQDSTDGVHWTTVGNPSATATSFIVNGLTAGKSYSFRIQAINAAGNSPFSNTGPITMPGATSIVQDINDPGVYFTGRWWWATFEPGYYGTQFVNDGDQGEGTKSVQFNVILPEAGTYNVSLWNPAGSQNATNVQVEIITASGIITVTVNEQKGGWLDLGSFKFGTIGSIILRTTGANGLVVADAVKFTPNA